MSFKVEITDKYTKIDGKTDEILAGIAMYTRALRMNGIPQNLIIDAFKLGLEEDRSMNCKEIRIHNLYISNIPKNERKNFIEKEIFKIFDED